MWYVDSPERIIDDLIERQSVFTAERVASDITEHVADPETFARVFREAMTHPDLLVLHEAGLENEGRTYTTRSQFLLETRVVDRAARLALKTTSSNPLFDPRDNYALKVLNGGNALKDIVAAPEHIRDAMRAVVSAPHLTIVSGVSGSGKTRFAADIQAVVNAHKGDAECVAVSITGNGRDALREAGFERNGYTFQSFANAAESGYILQSDKSVIILDQASLMGAKDAERLLEITERTGSKLVVLRDPEQYSPYSAGPIFDQVAKRVGSVMLEHSVRQLDEHARTDINLLRPDRSDVEVATQVEVVDRFVGGVINAGTREKDS